VPEGKYYLADAGYGLRKGFLVPYRGVRYHLKETAQSGKRPRNAQELFNLRNAMLRNAVERIFGILKRRFPILEKGSEYPFAIQVNLVIALMALHNFIRRHSAENEITNWELLDSASQGKEGASDEEEEQIGPDADQEMSDLRDQIAQDMWEEYLGRRRERRRRRTQ
jgi:hypothetical protein